MTLRKFMEQLNALIEKYPEALEMQVITSTDDEGNGFNRVYNLSTIGNYDGERYGEFIDKDNSDFREEYGLCEDDVNAVCIN